MKIPQRLEDLYPATAVEKLLEVLQHPDLSNRLKDTLNKVGIKDNNPLEQVQQAWQQARSWIESVAAGDQATTESEAINASGMWLESRIAAVPCNSTITQLVATHAARPHLQEVAEQRVQRQLRLLFPAHEACFATTCFAALQALTNGKTIFVAANELVRLKGLGAVRSMLCGREIIEVGEANGCSLEDWSAVLKGRSESMPGIVLSVTPFGSEVEDSQAQISERCRLAATHSLPTLCIAADAVQDSAVADKLGFPTLTRLLEAGCNTVVSPLHLLLGGPAGAIVVGDESELDGLGKTLRGQGTELPLASQNAAIVAMQAGQIVDETGISGVGPLLTNPENLRERARRIAVQIDNTRLVESASEVPLERPLGSSPWNRYSLSNWAVRVSPHGSVDELENMLLQGEFDSEEQILTPIIPFREGNSLLLDLRFVDPKDDHILVRALSPVGWQEASEDPNPDDASEPEQDSGPSA